MLLALMKTQLIGPLSLSRTYLEFRLDLWIWVYSQFTLFLRVEPLLEEDIT